MTRALEHVARGLGFGLYGVLLAITFPPLLAGALWVAGVWIVRVVERGP